MSTSLPIYHARIAQPRGDAGHTASVLQGLCKRLAVEPPPINKSRWKKFRRFHDIFLRQLRRKKMIHPLETVPDFYEWIEGTPYTRSRKDELIRVYENSSIRVSKRTMRRNKCFAKDEPYPEWKSLRGIYSRVDIAKCLFGPLVDAISKQIFSLPWFIKKIPVPDRPAAILERLWTKWGRYIFTDYTSFESHFRQFVQQTVEKDFYKFFVQDLPDEYKQEILKFLDIKAGTQEFVFKTFTIFMEAVRNSGEMDTSLMNGWMNLCLLLFCCHELGIPWEEVLAYVEGDDAIANLEDKPIPTQEQFADLGFTIKIGVTEKLSEASFCGQVYDIEDLAVVTDPKDVLSRVGWTNKSYVRAKDETLMELLRAKGYSLVYQYPGCPIISKLGYRILALTAGVTIRQSIFENMDIWEAGKLRAALAMQLPDYKEPGTNTRFLVERLYGVSVFDQKRIEKDIDNYGFGPFDTGLDFDPVWYTCWDKYVVCDGRDEPTPPKVQRLQDMMTYDNKGKRIHQLDDFNTKYFRR